MVVNSKGFIDKQSQNLDVYRKFQPQEIERLLVYPDRSAALIQARHSELAKYELESLISVGHETIQGLSILGHGYVGVVVLAKRQENFFALKIRRHGSKRDSLIPEADYLRRANENVIGPKVYQASQNFILMEFIEGLCFLEWLQGAIAHQRHQIIYGVLDNLLRQAFCLDQIGLDRDDMKCITKDVIVTADNKPVLLDFSNASGDRRPQNVTALVQGLFWGSVIARYLQPLLPHCNRETLVPFLRAYKTKRSPENFERLREAISLPV